MAAVMTPNKKTRRRNNAPNAAPQQSQPQYQQYDDNPYHSHHDGSQGLIYDPAALIASVQSALDQSNEHLNLSVLRRYEPDVLSIISTAPYAVLYVFVQQDQTWEKSGIEGTLFITACIPDAQGAERFRVIVLNRRGLDNFSSELVSPEDVDVTEQYIIIKGDVTGAEQDPDYEDEGPQIYGLWIFADPPPSSTSQMREYTGQVIVQCAERAAESRRLISEQETVRLAQDLANSHTSPGLVEETPPDGGAPTGRQLSLQELFGQSRAQDGGFSLKNHHSKSGTPSNPPPIPESSRPSMEQTMQTQPPVHQAQAVHHVQQTKPVQQTPSMFMTNPDTEFFRTGTTPSNAATPSSNGAHQGGAVEDLFKVQRGR